MSKQRERDEFISICTEEKIPVSVARDLLRYARTLHRIAELECSSEVADRDRVPCPAEKDTRYECCCDYGYQEAGKHSDVARVSAKSKRIEYRVVQLLAPFGIKPIFGGDPRGCVLKLNVPSGKTNGWGGEGVCVPC